MLRTELIEALDDFGDHLNVMVVQNGRRDRFFEIQALTLTDDPKTGESVIQIEINETPDYSRG